MSTLHILSSSPFSDDRLASCLRLLDQGDALLLCGDATYALRTPDALAALTSDVELFALDEDLQARNLTTQERATPIDYPAFVALSCRFDKVNSWL